MPAYDGCFFSHLTDVLLAAVHVDVERHAAVPAKHQLLRPGGRAVGLRPPRPHLLPSYSEDGHVLQLLAGERDGRGGLKVFTV